MRAQLTPDGIKFNGYEKTQKKPICTVAGIEPDNDGNISLNLSSINDQISDLDDELFILEQVPSKTFVLSQSTTSVDEGGSVTITLTTTNVFDGGRIPYTITPNGVDLNNDFTSTVAANGNFEIQNNVATLTLTLREDYVTESSLESFTLTLGITGNPSVTVIINDTTQDPTYSAVPQYSSVNEGTPLTISVATVGVSSGTTLYWSVSRPEDFSVDSGSFQVTGTKASSTGSFTVTPTADDTTETGTETFTVSIRTGNTSGTIVATTSSITIGDTSQTPSGPPAEYTNSQVFVYDRRDSYVNHDGAIPAIKPNHTTFYENRNGTWTVPSNASWIRVWATGGSGGYINFRPDLVFTLTHVAGYYFQQYAYHLYPAGGGATAIGEYSVNGGETVNIKIGLGGTSEPEKETEVTISGRSGSLKATGGGNANADPNNPTWGVGGYAYNTITQGLNNFEPHRGFSGAWTWLQEDHDPSSIFYAPPNLLHPQSDAVGTGVDYHFWEHTYMYGDGISWRYYWHTYPNHELYNSPLWPTNRVNSSGGQNFADPLLIHMNLNTAYPDIYENGNLITPSYIKRFDVYQYMARPVKIRDYFKPERQTYGYDGLVVIEWG